jgi:SAM-dependent methyltransferase
MVKKNLWDRLFSKYAKSIKSDKNADFAYERLVNSLSLLSLCDNTGSALDVGCGDGRFTAELEARYSPVFGIDYSSRMLQMAKKRCKNTTFISHDVETPFPTFETKFDLISCKLLLMYISEIDNLAAECFKILNSRGLLIVSVTHPFKWIVELRKGNLEKSYKGYLSEVEVSGKIAKDKNLKVKFINRTFERYVNTFTKHGFLLNTILETGVPDAFVVKYPKYLEFQKKPYRLNMRFIKP